MAHPTDPNCIFCKIIAGKIPCHKIYEDEHVLAFLDIGPLTKGHALVIPKGHYANLLEAPVEVVGTVASAVPGVAKAVLAAVGAKAFNLLVNSGAEAQQSVEHLHFHILPRFSDGTFEIPWQAGANSKPRKGRSWRKTCGRTCPPELVTGILLDIPFCEICGLSSPDCQLQ